MHHLVGVDAGETDTPFLQPVVVVRGGDGAQAAGGDIEQRFQVFHGGAQGEWAGLAVGAAPGGEVGVRQQQFVGAAGQ